MYAGYLQLIARAAHKPRSSMPAAEYSGRGLQLKLHWLKLSLLWPIFALPMILSTRTFSDFGAFIMSSLTHTFLDKWLPITLEYVMFASAGHAAS